MNLGVFLYHNETLEVPSQVVRDGRRKRRIKKLTTAHPGLTEARVQRFSRKENDNLGSILNMSFYHKFSFPSSCQYPIELFFCRFSFKMIINIVNYYLFDRLWAAWKIDIGLQTNFKPLQHAKKLRIGKPTRARRTQNFCKTYIQMYYITSPGKTGQNPAFKAS